MVFECFEKEASENKYALARYSLAHSDLQFYMGVVRILSFLILLLMDRHNRRKLQQSNEPGSSVAVVLPVYYDVINAFILWSLLFGILDISDESVTRNHVNVGVSFSLFHFLAESVTFFLLQPGAGRKDFRHAIQFGVCVLAISLSAFAMAEYMVGISAIVPIVVFTVYNSLLSTMYVLLLVTPVRIIFKRPALKPYAAFMLFYNIVWMVMNYVTYSGMNGSICGTYMVYICVDGVMVPLVLYYTLSLDSQYWQGFLSGSNNPLATDGWDVNLDIVSALSTSMNQPSFSTTQHIKVIHCGLINFKNKLGFASGGFSRVYFGKYNGEKVAIKMLFVMELTPSSIIEFFKEAQILHDLKNENVVECKGITIIPPAIGVVMERCANGSLFDFLYDHARGRKNNSMSTWFNTGHLTNNSNYSSNSKFSSKSSSASQRKSLFATPNSVRSSDVEMSPSKAQTVNEQPCEDPQPACDRPSESFAWDERASHHSPKRSPKFKTFFERRGHSLTRGAAIDHIRNREALFIRPSAEDFSDLICYEMMVDAAKGLAFIHSKGYMHCDIKSLNFLVTDNLRVKIADVGEARPIDKSHTPASKIGTRPMPALNWCPPEIISPIAPCEYSTASDVFGLAMTLSEILVVEPPLEEICNTANYAQWYQIIAEKGIRPKLPDSTFPEVRGIIEMGWHTDPSMRPTAQEMAYALGNVIGRRKSSVDPSDGPEWGQSANRPGADLTSL